MIVNDIKQFLFLLTCPVFLMILAEKWGFWRFIEDKIFGKSVGLIRINYTEICYFCWAFWICAIVDIFFFSNVRDYIYCVVISTIVTRLLTIQILRR
jgi:hypothetical protein